MSDATDQRSNGTLAAATKSEQSTGPVTELLDLDPSDLDRPTACAHS